MNKVKPTDKDLLEVAKWYIEQAISFNRDKDFLDFKHEPQLNLASTMAITQIAENVKNVSDEVKKRHPNFPWKQIVGMRNIITHNYDGVSMDIIWEAINEHLPATIEQLNDILANDEALLHADKLVENRYEFRALKDLKEDPRKKQINIEKT